MGTRCFGARLVPFVVFFGYARRSDLKISMVGIDKVKVRLLTLSLAHVSHFFSHMLQSVHCR